MRKLKKTKLISRAVIMALVLTSLLTMAAPPRPASAHPMGNFTINHYSALTVGKSRVDILYVVDMAEIPAYQELQTIRDDRSTNLTTSESDAYTARKAKELLPNILLSINGQLANLTLLGKPALSFPAGVGGLPTLRLELRLRAPIDGIEKGPLEYRDDNYKDRIGWKEIIALPGPGVSLDKSSVPATDLSDELRKYPPDRINDPPRVTYASLTFAGAAGGASATGGAPVTAAQSSPEMWGSLAWVKQQTDTISEAMKQKDLPLGALLAALAIAFSIGAAHALAPGHGKTVVAAYLVGSRGTALHAIALGLIVTLSHTMGVFVLGFVVLYLANFILPEALYPWLSFLSGALLVIMGITLFVQRYRSWKREKVPALQDAQPGTHTHEDTVPHAHTEGHTHDHTHDHARDDPAIPHKHGMFSRSHTHVPAGEQKVTLGNLLVLGITGGIVPCPSALVVLLVGVASGQIALGLLLIMAFSVGLAGVLMGIGLLMVYSRNLLNRFKFRSGRFTALFGRLPMASALAVSGLGLLIALRAFNIGL